MTFNRISINKITERERGYLMGLFTGDGYAYHDKKYRHYAIEFYLHSKRNVEIQTYLMKILDKLGLKVFILKDKRYNCNRIKVHSKQLMEFLNLELQVKGNIEMGIGFVSGMIDAEGYVNHEKSFANIVNTDLDVLKKCKDVFEKLGIDVNIKKRNRYKKDKKSSYILNIPYKVKNIKLNSIKLTAG